MKTFRNPPCEKRLGWSSYAYGLGTFQLLSFALNIKNM